MICHIAEPHEMPIDSEGNRADIVMDPDSTIARMNFGRSHENYINAASRDVVKRIARITNIPVGDKDAIRKVMQLEMTDTDIFENAWNMLIGYYGCINPEMEGWFLNDSYQGTRYEHLGTVIKEGIYLYIPPENEPEYMDIIEAIKTKYPPHHGPVTYIGTSGKQVVTKDNVRIGSNYIMLLEKIADDWTAVSSGKLQHFGVLSQVTNADKYSQPTRQQAIRAWGEAEVRIGVSYVGPKMMVDILDRNNNPATHKHILRNILTAPQPTNIESVVDRRVQPLGGSKPLQLVKHLAEVAGWRFRFKSSQK